MTRTTTPDLTPLSPLVRTAGKSLGPEKTVMLAGNALPEKTGIPDHYKCLHAPDAVTAQRVITEVLHLWRTAPVVIIISQDACCTSWKKFFDEHAVLRTIPFFMYAANPTPALKTNVREQGFIDEIITGDCLRQHLDEKISFVTRFKQLSLYKTQEIKSRMPDTVIRRRNRQHIGKRLVDILLAGTALLLLSPLLLLIALLIRMESPGPVIYAARRAGRNYRIFPFYKFRTMVQHADRQLDQLKHLNQYDARKGGAVFYKLPNDPRITRLGAFLRNTSLDELPQLFNVLTGDMSIVGNRPLPLYEAATLTTDEWAQRFLAPAGITGLWQVSKRGKKHMSAEERIGLDIRYADRCSFTMDMWIMINTPLALVQKQNV